MNQHQNGIILLTVLIILGLLSLLVLAQFEQLLLQRSALNNQLKIYDSFKELEKTAKNLIKNLPNDDDGEIISQSYHFDYHITDLGYFPCLPISAANQKIYLSHHWQLTLKEKSQSKLTLQLRFATPSQLHLQCKQNNVRFIQPGIQAWTISHT